SPDFDRATPRRGRDASAGPDAGPRVLGTGAIVPGLGSRATKDPETVAIGTSTRSSETVWRSPRPRVQRSLPLVGLAAGLGIEAIYLLGVVGPFSLLTHGAQLTDLGQLTGHQPIAGVAVAVAVVALFALYGVAMRAISRPSDGGLPLVLGGSIVFSLTLIFLYPITAIDVYTYAVQGHIVVFQYLNPLLVPPSTARGDAFIAFAGSWVDRTSPYGPVWIALSSLDALLAGSDIILAIAIFKALGALAVVATTIL